MPGVRKVATYAGHERGILSAVFSPDGRQLLTGGKDGTAREWDVATGAARQTFDWGLGGVSHVAWGPDGAVCAAGNSKGDVVVWDADA
jgi:WD40 repeat protein